jgi:hypothetical protein
MQQLAMLGMIFEVESKLTMPFGFEVNPKAFDKF